MDDAADGLRDSPARPDPAVIDGLLMRARKAGFAIIDLRDVFSEVDAREIIVAEWDRHPNSEGHRIIADKLFESVSEVLALRRPIATRE